MYLRKKHLSRRTMLKGAGVALSLPFLEAMVPARTALSNTAAAGKKRVGFFYLPHGAIMDNTPYGKELDAWTPSGNGSDLKFNTIMEPLQPYRDYVTTFGGLENLAGNNSVHIWNPSTWLSCTKPEGGATGPSMAQTVDQLIAGHIGQGTPLPSLEVAAETTIQVAACAGGDGCFYSSTLSWQGPHAPLPMEFNPRKVFTQLFGEGDSPAEREAIAAQTHSLLDLISDRTASLKRDLGATDKARLDDYLDTVREIERRLQQAGSRDISALDLPETPIGELEDFDEQVKLLFDLIALAYQADLTRVASYIMVAEGTNRTYNHIGVPDSFHPVSHHANDKDKIGRLVRIQRYHMERFAEFIGKLAEMPDGENTVLENSMFLYGSNMSNSDRHNNYPLPITLVGHGMGTVKGAQHIVLPDRSPLANVHLTMLNKLGLPQESFADSTGVISEV